MYLESFALLYRTKDGIKETFQASKDQVLDYDLYISFYFVMLLVPWPKKY